MSLHLAAVTVVVPDYDEAIDFFVRRLGFDLVEDVPLSPSKRWVVVAPRGGSGTRLLLAKAATPEQSRAIGNQAGGRVFMFLWIDDFARDYSAMKAAGVEFLEEPREEDYGLVAVFRDPFGNRWDLAQPTGPRAN